MPNNISARLIFPFCKFYKKMTKTTKHIHLHPKPYYPMVIRNLHLIGERQLHSRKQYFLNNGLEVVKAGTVMSAIFWEVMACFRGTHCIASRTHLAFFLGKYDKQ
jgi:hypothetical protein